MPECRFDECRFEAGYSFEVTLVDSNNNELETKVEEFDFPPNVGEKICLTETHHDPDHVYEVIGKIVTPYFHGLDGILTVKSDRSSLPVD